MGTVLRRHVTTTLQSGHCCSAMAAATLVPLAGASLSSSHASTTKMSRHSGRKRSGTAVRAGRRVYHSMAASAVPTVCQTG